MPRTHSKLGPALFLAAMTLAATALAAARPHSPWSAQAGVWILVLALVGTEVVQRRRAGAGSWPSPVVLLLATTLLAAGFILAGDREALAGMMPVLGTCAAMPFILRAEDARPTCRRA